MPPEATNVPGTLPYEDRLHHCRSLRGEPSPPHEGRAAGAAAGASSPKIASVHGKRAKLYEKRQRVLNLGRNALALLTEITHRHGKLAGRHVEDLYALLRRTGTTRCGARSSGRSSTAGSLSSAYAAIPSKSVRRHDGERHCVPERRNRADDSAPSSTSRSTARSQNRAMTDLDPILKRLTSLTHDASGGSHSARREGGLDL